MKPKFRNLRLRFVVEGEPEGGVSTVDQTLDNLNPTSVGTETPDKPEGNPAWEPLRSKLDPISFHAIQDDLKAMDAAANQRITDVNARYEPYKAFAEQGINPQQIQQALAISQQINERPEDIYQYLGQFLQQTGRMPSQQEVQAASAAGEIGEEAEPQVDPRFDQLSQQQQAIMQFLQEQQRVEAARQAETSLDTETSQLKATHPELTDEDVKEVIRRAAFVAQQNLAQGNHKIPSLEDAYTDFNALRTRILSTPRPGDSAPRLLPTSGGIPSAVGQKTLGQLSRTETQDLLAGLLDQNKSRG